ncbi:uncharacterized protein AruCF_1675 [Achromobacter ruhlandii]|nr:uncharacterized protein AruCF_1675 [Achromobacter ruhlandii]
MRIHDLYTPDRRRRHASRTRKRPRCGRQPLCIDAAAVGTAWGNQTLTAVSGVNRPQLNA